eukprot:g2962.t1
MVGLSSNQFQSSYAQRFFSSSSDEGQAPPRNVRVVRGELIELQAVLTSQELSRVDKVMVVGGLQSIGTRILRGSYCASHYPWRIPCSVAGGSGGGGGAAAADDDDSREASCRAGPLAPSAGPSPQPPASLSGRPWCGCNPRDGTGCPKRGWGLCSTSGRTFFCGGAHHGTRQYHERLRHSEAATCCVVRQLVAGIKRGGRVGFFDLMEDVCRLSPLSPNGRHGLYIDDSFWVACLSDWLADTEGEGQRAPRAPSIVLRKRVYFNSKICPETYSMIIEKVESEWGDGVAARG